MKFNLFKFFKSLTLGLMCFAMIFFICVSVNAATFVKSGMIYFASTQYGEDSSTMATIHFHSESANVYCMVTTQDDTNFEKAFRVDLEKVKVDFSAPLASKPGIALKQDEDFPEGSYECTGRMENLTPGTKYMWYATDGKEKGDIYYFRTSEGNNTKYTFSLTSDPQTYTSGSRWDLYNEWSENIFQTAEINKMDISFLLNLGDIVENSGRASHWSYSFGPTVYKKIAAMATPGNHDFTGLVSSGSTDGRFFAAMWGNPLNGPEDVMDELCYYFTYNDTLFVTLSCSCSSRTAQVEWLDQVLKNNPAQYKVVCMHYPANSTATDNSKEFIPVYQKYNVDLVLFGHTHTYAVQRNYLDMKKSSDEYVGTTYISPSSPEGASGSIICNQLFFTVDSSMIQFKSFTQDSVQYETFALKARRVPTSETANFDEEVFVNSFKAEINQETLTSGKITFDKSAYNNIYQITIKDSNGKELGSKVIADSVNNYISVSGLTPNTEYKTKITYEYYDGTKKEIDWSFKTNISSYGTIDIYNTKEPSTKYGYRLYFKKDYRAEVKSVAIYVDGVKTNDLSLTDVKVEIPVEYLPEGKKHIIEFRAVLEDGEESVMHTIEYGESSDKHTVKFLGKDGTVLKEELVAEGEAATAPTAPEVEGFVFKGWDKEFASVTSDLTVTALYEEKGTQKEYTVKFLGKDGTVLKEEKVKEGEAATAPTAPEVDGFAFKGWDKEFASVTSDLTVTALYEEKGTQKEYTVKFLGKDGTVLKEEKVKEGEAATAPTAPEVDGFAFKGWDKEFASVTSDLTITAQYEAKKSSGCGNSASILFTSLLLLGLVFIRRKKF